MKLLGRKPTAVPVAPVAAEPERPLLGKGRPTPKRREAEGRRGPVAPPPKTQREAIQRAKTVSKPMTKDERKVASVERRERMMRGDDAYVLPRDRGPVRAYVRDLVDARRNLAGLLMPAAVLSFIILLSNVRVLTAYGPLVMLVAILVAIADSAVFGRQIRRKVLVRFPNGDPGKLSVRGRSLSFYAFNRSLLPRRWRVPRARVSAGATID